MMKDPWIKRGAALLIGGICGGYAPEEAVFWILGIIVLLGLRLLLWQPRDFFGRLFRPEILLLGATLALGFVYGALANRLLPPPLILDQVEIIGRVKDWNQGEDKLLGVVQIEEIKTDLFSSNRELSSSEVLPAGNMADPRQGLLGKKFRLTVYEDTEGEVPSEWQRVQPGDLVQFPALLEQPKSLGTPSAFDSRLYYNVRGLSGTMRARGDAVLLSAGEPGLSWKIRRQVNDQLQAWETEETGVLEGILFGDTNRIPDTVQEQYKVTGVLHVFAASGSNVAFVLGLFWLLLGFLPKQIRIGGTILALLLYAALCGGNAPIVRATVLGVAILLGRLGRGKVAGLRWLTFAAVGLFLHNPLIIQDLGFQLSFAAAWGLVVLCPRILRWRGLQYLPKLLQLAVAATLAAQIATLPFLITAFHRLSLIGFVTNVFILFVLGSVLEVGLIGVLLSFFGVLSEPFFQVSLWLLAGTNTVLGMLAAFPYADVWVLNPGVLFWVIWYGGMGTFLWGKERLFFILWGKALRLARWLKNVWVGLEKRCPPKFSRRVGQGGQALQALYTRIKDWPAFKRPVFLRWSSAVCIFLLLWSPWHLPRDLEVVMIDVGQGDAILIRTPKDYTVLIDTGPRSERFDAGERIIIPYLLHRKIGRLDALLLSHEHQDHSGGARAVLANIPTDWVGIPAVGDRLDNEEWQEGLPSELVGGPVGSEKLKTFQAGERIDLDLGIWLDVLAPAQVLEGTNSDPNNNSLVLKLNYMGKSMLLTGDMEQEEMTAILESGVDFNADIFKVPHHGSRSSLDADWLDRIHPQGVLISVGKNSFGHPTPEVLAYWEERQIPIYRTDEHGTLRLLFSEKGIEILCGR